jgi:hypothetical protein
MLAIIGTTQRLGADAVPLSALKTSDGVAKTSVNVLPSDGAFGKGC